LNFCEIDLLWTYLSLRSRHKAESDGEVLQTVGPVELQKLGIVPNTIFLGSRQPQQAESTRKSSVSDSRLLRQSSSFDQTLNVPGAPFEDLKRRLATINGSNTSLNSATGSARGRVVSAPRLSQPVDRDLPNSIDFRPGSPTESIVSTANSAAIKPRFSIGSTESQKAPPAIGSMRTNAVGMLEAPSKLRLDTSPDRTGMPVSSMGTSYLGIRAQTSSGQNDGEFYAVIKANADLHYRRSRKHS